MRTEPTVFDDTPCRLGEGVVPDGPGHVLWVDIPAGCVLRKSTEGGSLQRVEIGQSVGCVFPSERGGYIAGLREGIATFDFERGITGWIDWSIAADPETRCNDGAIDRRGRLWVGVMRDDQREGSGSLIRIGDGGSPRVAREGLTVPNGIAWSADGRLMYHIDSPRRVVEAIEFDEDRGELGSVVRTICTPEQWGYPDGMTIDSEGLLWVSHWGGGRLSRWDPGSGNCEGEIVVPASNVTSCAFAGEGSRDLYITTARDGGRSGGEVYVCRPGPTGQEPPPSPYRPHDGGSRSEDRA